MGSDLGTYCGPRILGLELGGLVEFQKVSLGAFKKLLAFR